MIRITKMSGRFYGIELTDDQEKEMNEIEIFVNEGTPVIVVDSIESLEELGIYEDVLMIDRD